MTSIDQKIDRLWELYRDFAIIKELPVDVEEIKRRGMFFGIGTTIATLAVNEYSRFAFRSPLFKMTILNSLLILTVPSLYFNWCAKKENEEKIFNLWRIHKNREHKGLGATY